MTLTLKSDIQIVSLKLSFDMLLIGLVSYRSLSLSSNETALAASHPKDDQSVFASLSSGDAHASEASEWTSSHAMPCSHSITKALFVP